MTPLAYDDDAVVRSYTTDKVFERAVALYESEAVVQRLRRGDTLYGAVEGSEPRPYRVTVELRPATGLGGRGHRVASVACTCPYSFEGWCKHAAALVLSAIEMPASIGEQPGLDETLASADADALRGALLALVEAHPELVDEIEARVEGREPPEPLGHDADGW